MTTAAIATSYKRYVDETLNKYLPKIKTLRTLYNEISVDAATVILEYSKLTQTYAEATGYNAFSLPESMAEGTNATLQSMGTEDSSSSPVKYGLGFKITREEELSKRAFIMKFVAEKTIASLQSVETLINSNLAAGLIANASGSYSASATWVTTGKPFLDVSTAKNSFRKRTGIDPDFIVVHPDNYVSVEQNDRVQSTIYSPNTTWVETGKMLPNLMGLNWVIDATMTKGTFIMGKKGMFGDLFTPIAYTMYEQDKGAAGKVYESVISFVAQYKMPYYLLKGTGI